MIIYIVVLRLNQSSTLPLKTFESMTLILSSNLPRLVTISMQMIVNRWTVSKYIHPYGSFR